MSPIKLTNHSDPTSLRQTICASFEPTIAREMAEGILREILEQIATRYVEEHYVELAAKLDQNAIATLAVAAASKQVAEAITVKPTVLHDTRTETKIFQRGLLGGIKRVG